ncbi:adenine deaminase C-terminal domain-containing protein [Halococcus saccharolyticus]|uniref:Adenine deaminase n=1 Tax=Halococcus saccharolyticus DSM 5350 TaxID=1227455 RepID=M0MDK8_9EURY|nr:adenine deaminase C-terminal domain-containing protein [Halococcus saccharolyticus]EMA43826.1 adenine deaminase [Halococcus saccharolyticus DSM 5350]
MAMARLANHLRTIDGGLGVYDPRLEDAENDTAGITTLELPIPGLLSSKSSVEIARILVMADDAARDLGLTLSDGVMELDNLTLEVIPELRLTDRGFVDVRAGSIVDVVLDTE